MAKATTQTKATKSETKSETKVEAKSEPKVEAKKGGKKAVKEVKAEAPTEVKVEAPTEVKVEAHAEVKVEAPAEVKVEAPAQETKKGRKKDSAKVAKAEEPVTKVEVKKGGKKETVETPKETVETPKETKKGGKKAAKAEETGEAEEHEGEVNTKPGHRFFRCVFKNTDGEIVHAGRYSGKKPKQAARKALTGIVKKNELEVGERVMFLIQECTRGSKKKKYSYVGAQVNLEHPITVTIRKKDGQKSEIIYTKDNEVKKVSLSECGDLLDVEMEEDEAPVEVPVRLQRKPVVKKASKKAGKKSAKEVKEEEVPAKESRKTKSK